MKGDNKKHTVLIPALFFVVLVFGAPDNASASSRYWVGDAGTWDGSDTSHWSDTSGGGGGFSVPTSTDDVFFDDNSFSGPEQTVTLLAVDANCLNMTWTSPDSPILFLGGAGRHLNIFGSLVLARGMTVSGSGDDAMLLSAPSGTFPITTNGVTILPSLHIQGGATYTLHGDLHAASLHLVRGTFEADGSDVTLGTFESTNANTRELHMGSGMWTLNGTGGTVWDITNSTGLTFDAGGSTLETTDTGAKQKTFQGGALTYHVATFSGRNIVINNSNAFETLNVFNAGLADALYFQNDSNQLVGNFATNGSAGNLATIRTSRPPGSFGLTKLSGTVSVDFISITDSHIFDGATWNAGPHSINGGGSTSGWIFANPSSSVAPSFPNTGIVESANPSNLVAFGLHEGEVVGSADAGDPDVYIVNAWGYKRLFLNPVIFSFYGHLGGMQAIKHIASTARDSLPTSGLFRNCETGDEKVYALEVTGEDTGTLHWVNMTGDQAIAQDPDFFKRGFCINSREFSWYGKSPVDYTSLSQLPQYRR